MNALNAIVAALSLEKRAFLEHRIRAKNLTPSMCESTKGIAEEGCRLRLLNKWHGSGSKLSIEITPLLKGLMSERKDDL